MKAQISILVLQELLRKAKCNNLINSGIIELKNNTISTSGSGIELAGKIDGRMSFSVTYPCIVEEEGILPIKNFSDFLSKTEIFEKEDLTMATIVENKLVLNREIPKRVLTYDLGDPKHIPTAHKGKTNIIFNNKLPAGEPLTTEQIAADAVPPYVIPSVIIVNPSGKTKEIFFTGEVVVDSVQLKSFASAAEKIAPLKIPMQIVDGRLNSAIKGIGTDLMAEIRVDKVNGEALSRYGVHILEIFKVGFGNATLRFANDSSIHIRFQQDEQKSDYLLVSSTNAASPATPPAVKKNNSGQYHENNI